MINPLYDPFPDHVVVQGQEYEVVTDFREWIKFYALVKSDLPDIIKLELMLEWYLDDVPEDTEEAIAALGRFLGAYELYEKEGSDEETGQPNVQAFSFEQDASDIYSAFLSAYGIDIQDVEYMHWYKFRTLFDSLPGETEIKRKMHYRTMDTGKIKDKDERARVRMIQDKIRIKNRKKKNVDDYEIGDTFW